MLNKAAKKMVLQNGGKIIGEEYFALDYTDCRETVRKIMQSGTEVVFKAFLSPKL